MEIISKDMSDSLRLFTISVDNATGTRTSLLRLTPLALSGTYYLGVEEWLQLLQALNNQSTAFENVETVLRPLIRLVYEADQALYRDIEDNAGLDRTRLAFQPVSKWNRQDRKMTDVYHAGLRLIVLDRVAAASRVADDQAVASQTPFQIVRLPEIHLPSLQDIVDQGTKMDIIDVLWLSGMDGWTSTVHSYISSWDNRSSRQSASQSSSTSVQRKDKGVLKSLIDSCMASEQEQRLLTVRNNIYDSAISLLAYSSVSHNNIHHSFDSILTSLLHQAEPSSAERLSRQLLYVVIRRYIRNC